jgi:hypothetical protein
MIRGIFRWKKWQEYGIICEDIPVSQMICRKVLVILRRISNDLASEHALE